MSGQENQESFIDFSVIFFPLLVTPQPGLLRWFFFFFFLINLVIISQRIRTDSDLLIGGCYHFLVALAILSAIFSQDRQV